MKVCRARIYTKLLSVHSASGGDMGGDLILKLQIIGDGHKFKTEEVEKHRNGVGKLVLCEKGGKNHFLGLH